MLVEKNSYHLILEDLKIWRKDLLVMYLYECFIHNKNIVIDSYLEGSCCRTNGLYRVLDEFCNKTKFPSNRITIRTANLVEFHHEYNIVRIPEYWYEVKKIQQWLLDKKLTTSNNSKKHFGNFIGRSSWYRIWIASLLNSKYKDKTVQTFNSGLQSQYIVKNDGRYDYLGLEELVRYGCNILPQVIEFLQTCPRVIPDDIEYIKTVKSYIPQTDYYPIQHPANLNILNQYPDIFVDIVCETRVLGNVFFVTEKTWRCIVAKRPFIIVGSQFFLQNLKKLGFKTFNEFWDEGYDEYPSGYRIKEIEKLLSTIAEWPVQKLVKILEEMQSILDHNYNIFQELTYQKIAETFNEQK
jgi:hypothetical protein